jgi:hypothetical protein
MMLGRRSVIVTAFRSMTNKSCFQAQVAGFLQAQVAGFLHAQVAGFLKYCTTSDSNVFALSASEIESVKFPYLRIPSP